MATWITKNPKRAAEFISARTGMKITTAMMLTKSRRYDFCQFKTGQLKNSSGLLKFYFGWDCFPIAFGLKMLSGNKN
jgi:hypothetical protein